jgi:D-ribose pyranose/furanose isomerase RbsD
MKLKLEPLRTSDLTNMEGGQLFKRHLSDLGTIDPALLIDAPLNTYIQVLTTDADSFEKALAQVRKNEETDKIVLADGIRDKGLDAIGRALKLYAISDDPAEVEASRSISILFDSFKSLANLSYEAETIGIDKLASELTGPNYSPKISLLQMDRYVTRVSNANEAFKTLFSGRMVTTAMTESFDMKTIRKETFKRYSEFCDYVLAMAKALNTPLFITSLNLLNTSRKYYSDQLARRTAVKPAKAKPIV